MISNSMFFLLNLYLLRFVVYAFSIEFAIKELVVRFYVFMLSLFKLSSCDHFGDVFSEMSIYLPMS